MAHTWYRETRECPRKRPGTDRLQSPRLYPCRSAAAQQISSLLVSTNYSCAICQGPASAWEGSTVKNVFGSGGRNNSKSMMGCKLTSLQPARDSSLDSSVDSSWLCSQLEIALCLRQLLGFLFKFRKPARENLKAHRFLKVSRKSHQNSKRAMLSLQAVLSRQPSLSL